MNPPETYSTRPVSGMSEIRSRMRRVMPRLRLRYGVEQLGVFGSYARGEQTGGSDVDLLVTFSEKPDLFDYAALERDIEGVLGRSVDLGTPGELRSFVRKDVEEVRYL